MTKLQVLENAKKKIINRSAVVEILKKSPVVQFAEIEKWQDEYHMIIVSKFYWRENCLFWWSNDKSMNIMIKKTPAL